MHLKKTIVLLLACLLLALTGCAGTSASADDATLHVATSTYPVYLFTQTVTQGVDSTAVSLVIDQEVSCLHDYTLSISDMKAVEQADVLILNGAGLEDFLSDVLDGRNCVDASDGIELLWNEAEQEEDPHIWMDPNNAAIMIGNIADALSAQDPGHEAQYQANAQSAQAELAAFYDDLLEELDGQHFGLITFHDGFGYFARSFGLDLLRAVEEEEGGEASAKTITEIVGLVQAHQLPAIFTEVNGSDATALAISRECDIAVYPLSMCMSGDGGGLDAYEAVLRQNIETILEAFS